MRWFDRWSKLRDVIKLGRLHTEQRELLSLLEGKVTRQDIPAVVVEPAGEAELEATLSYAAEKGLKVAVSSGLRPLQVKNLADAMLILTTRISGAPIFSSDKLTVQVDAGLSAEVLAIDLQRAQRRWLPLFPVPAGKSLGSLIADGREGLRVWRDGSLPLQVRSVDWMGYDGKKYSTGPAASGAQAPDLFPLLFGQGSRFGILTSVELALVPVAEQRTTALFELACAEDAQECLSMLRSLEGQPETVVYWGAAATDLIRKGNDGTISDECVVSILAEWDHEVRWPVETIAPATVLTSADAIQSLWLDVFRLPKTASRLFPQRAEGRVRVWSEQLADLERAASAIGHDANLMICIWGTADAGHMHVWALVDDEEQRSMRRAEEAVGKILRLVESWGGCAVDEPRDSLGWNGGKSREAELATQVAKLLQSRSDPHGIGVGLN